MSATLASTLITGAARDIGVIASGEALSTDEQADSLVVLNQLIDTWSGEQIPLPTLTQTTISLSGTSATTARPLKILSAKAVNGSFSQQVEIVSAVRWSQIIDAARSGGFPDILFC